MNSKRCNVGPNLAKKLGIVKEILLNLLKSTPADSFVMSCVTETQVCLLFKCLNDHKSSIDTGIPNKLYHNSCSTIVSTYDIHL